MSNVRHFPLTREAANRLAERLIEQARREDKKVVWRRFGRNGNHPDGDGPRAA